MTKHSNHPLRGLYAITPDEHLTSRLVLAIRAAIAGGVRLVQYRNKTASPSLRREQALQLLAECRNSGAQLIINDDIDLALELDADGVHIGRDDVPGGSLAKARAALGPRRLLGVSCYNDLAIAAAAADAGADYLALGSIFSSPTKPAATPASLELVAQVKARFGLPVAAIGGITVANAPQVLTAGADLLAVISDLFAAPDVKQRAQDFAALWINPNGTTK